MPPHDAGMMRHAAAAPAAAARCTPAALCAARRSSNRRGPIAVTAAAAALFALLACLLLAAPSPAAALAPQRSTGAALAERDLYSAGSSSGRSSYTDSSYSGGFSTAAAAAAATAEAEAEQLGGSLQIALEFLWRNQPKADRGVVKDRDLVRTAVRALRARRATKWAAKVPLSVWLEDVLPYRHLDEPYEDWRPLLQAKVAPLVANASSAAEAAQVGRGGGGKAAAVFCAVCVRVSAVLLATRALLSRTASIRPAAPLQAVLTPAPQTNPPCPPPWSPNPGNPLSPPPPSPPNQIINRDLWGLFGPEPIYFKPDQTPEIMAPSQVIKAGYASCTGLSILLASACRAAGVPARVAGTRSWAAPVPDRAATAAAAGLAAAAGARRRAGAAADFDSGISGSTSAAAAAATGHRQQQQSQQPGPGRFNNHNWVEVFDPRLGWSFTGACEYSPAGLNVTWFFPQVRRTKRGRERGRGAEREGQGADGGGRAQNGKRSGACIFFADPVPPFASSRPSRPSKQRPPAAGKGGGAGVARARHLRRVVQGDAGCARRAGRSVFVCV